RWTPHLIYAYLIYEPRKHSRLFYYLGATNNENIMTLAKHLKGEEANLGLIAAFGEIFGIPYASTLLSFYSVYKNYQAGTLQNKLVQYMHGINEMTFPKREKLRQKIESDKNFKRDVVSVLLEMID